MMRECWDAEPETRPSFSQLVTDITNRLERKCGYLQLMQPVYIAKQSTMSLVSMPFQIWTKLVGVRLTIIIIVVCSMIDWLLHDILIGSDVTRNLCAYS